MRKTFFYPQTSPGFNTRRRRDEANHPVDGELVDGFSNPWICVRLVSSPSFGCVYLEADGWDLYVAIDIEAIVFGGQHHGAVVHQGNVKALGVLHLVIGVFNFKFQFQAQ